MFGIIRLKGWFTALLALAVFSACGSESPSEPKDEPKEEAPNIVSFQASEDTVWVGATVSLSWVTERANTVRLLADGESVPMGGVDPERGSFQVQVEETTTFELIAVGASGQEATRSLEVRARVPGEPFVEAFTLEPAEVTHGETTTLSWIVTDAEQVEIFDGETAITQSQQMTNSVTVAPERRTTYTLVATGPGGEATAEATVSVIPSILLFEASPEVVEADPANPGEVTLSWQIRGVESIEIHAEPGAMIDVTGADPSFGQVTTTVTGPTSFTLIARGVDTASDRTIEVTTRDVPRIVSFEAPARVGASEDFALTWELANTVSYELEKDGVVVAQGTSLTGSRLESLTEEATYLLRGFGEEAQVEIERIIEVGAPEILGFAPDAERVSPSATVQLSWETKGGSSLRLVDSEGGELFTSSSRHEIAAGSFEVQAPASAAAQRFELRIENSDGEAVEVAGFAVGEGPLIWDFAADAARVPGGSEAVLRWEVGDDAFGEVPTLALTDDQGTAYPLVDGEDSLEVTMADDESRVFTLVATTPTGSMERSATVVAVGPPTVELTATPEVFDPAVHLNVMLEWTTTNGVNLEIFSEDDQGSRTLVTSRTDPGQVANGLDSRPPTTFPVTYVAVVRNEFGVEAEDSVTIVQQGTDITFTATPQTVTGRETVTLEWDVAGATQVALEPTFLGGTLDPYMDISQEPGAVEVGVLEYECFTDVLARDDNGCVWINFPAGFEFPFGGDVKTGARVYVNGFISFDSTQENSTNANQPLPHPGWSDFVHLAPFWDNLGRKEPAYGFGGTGAIYHLHGTDSRGQYLVIQWHDWKIENTADEGPPNSLNFQVILWEDGGFDFRYGAMDVPPAEASVAREEGSSATIALQVDNSNVTLISHNQAFPGGLENFGFRFAPLEVARSGSITAVPLETTTYTLVAGSEEEDVTVTVTP